MNRKFFKKLEKLELAKTEIENLNEYEAQGAAIRCKANYSVMGERPTRYFCALEKNNATSRYISRLNINGRISRNQKEIENEIFRYYKTLYKYPGETKLGIEEFLGDDFISLKKITEKEKLSCEGEITMVEIGKYLKKIRNNKSPGSDGFTGEFFKFFYPNLKIRLFNSIKQTYADEKLPISQNLGITTLLPKGKKSKEFLTNLRPLTLLNTYYKIISGVIAERIKPVLNRIIHSDQKGFLQGRYIGEAVRSTYDTIEYAKSNNLSGAILLIDFSKAYDSLSHFFIKDSLRAFNFGESLCRWVDILISDFYSVINHAGNISEKFLLATGTKQGDPISGYLYILGSEILAHKLRCKHSDIGFKFNTGLNLLEIYADDLTIFLQANENDLDSLELNMRAIIRTISDFKKVSNLSVNLEKTSAIPFGNICDYELTLCNDLGIKWEKEFKLLGIYIKNNLENSEDRMDGYMIEISKLLNNWKNRYLSPFGKITVIKTLALPKITHIALVTPELDYNYAKKLEIMFYKFLWNGKPDKIAREACKMPYSKGGLNMTSVQEFWNSLKVSWLRRVALSPDTTWINILRNGLAPHNYLPEDLLKIGNSELRNLGKNLTNMFWKSVLINTANVNENVQYINPQLFCLNNVCGNSLFRIGNLTISSKMFGFKSYVQVADFLDENSEFLTRDSFQTRTGFNLNFLDFNNIKHAIVNGALKAGIRLGSVETFSRPRPTLTFSILTRRDKGCQTFYKILMGKKFCQHFNSFEGKWHEELHKTFDVKTWDRILSNIGQINFHNDLKWLQMRITRRILHTNAILSKYNPNIRNICDFCIMEHETLSHFFFKCQKVQELYYDFGNFLLNHNIILNIDIKAALFGFTNKPAMSMDNLILLFVRGFLWNSKYKKVTPSLKFLKCYLLVCVKDLKNIYMYINKESNFVEWQ